MSDAGKPAPKPFARSRFKKDDEDLYADAAKAALASGGDVGEGTSSGSVLAAVAVKPSTSGSSAGSIVVSNRQVNPLELAYDQIFNSGGTILIPYTPPSIYMRNFQLIFCIPWRRISAVGKCRERETRIFRTMYELQSAHFAPIELFCDHHKTLDTFLPNLALDAYV